MERIDIFKFFIKKAFKEGIIDENIETELNNFADWLDENLDFEEI